MWGYELSYTICLILNSFFLEKKPLSPLALGKTEEVPPVMLNAGKVGPSWVLLFQNKYGKLFSPRLL